jgi:ketol-acid reductoisomerase
MARIFQAADVDRTVLDGKTIAVIGYGNQGRSQALNLRVSGRHVIVGNREDESWRKAREDGFETHPMDRAATLADIVMLLLPDEVAPPIFDELIRPNLVRGNALVMASGYNVTYNHVIAPADVDVVLVAPRMIGQGVFELASRNEGVPILVGVHQDATGKALAVALALADGIGGFLPHGVVVESSFNEETLVDLFTEHTWAGAFLYILDKAFRMLIEGGVSREVAILELYGSGEIGEIGRAMATDGLWRQLRLHSHTSQFGQLTHGADFVDRKVEALMRKAIAEIRSGAFDRRWTAEQARGLPLFRRLLDEVLSSPLSKAEDELYARLGRR